MRRALVVLAGLVAVGAVALSASSRAVPSFTRQTGMTCAQCHVLFGAPVPNFTFTGKKFRINGYRVPFVTERIEAGEEGALTGKRLSMSLFPYLSLRYQSVFASQSRSPFDPSGPTPDASPIESNPTSRLAIFTGGPVADYFGLWTEMYLTTDGSPTGEWTLGLFSLDEFDLRFVKMSGNNTFGLAFNNQGITEVSGFGPWPVSIPQELNRGGFRGWSHPNRGNLIAYAWLNDRLLVSGGASPGQNNLDWDRLKYLGQLAYAIKNSDEQELWASFMFSAGNDDIPIITSARPTGSRTWTYSSTVGGIDATRPTPGPYLSDDLQSSTRMMADVRYSFIDRGPHSMEVMGRVSVNQDKFRPEGGAQAAEVKRNDVGGAVRYVYNRTYGLDFGLWQPVTYEFTDVSGTKYDINQGISYRGYASFQPAMNIILALSYGNSSSVNINRDAWNNGWSWALNIDFLF